jgi:16S rRNA processing protein RimM
LTAGAQGPPPSGTANGERPIAPVARRHSKRPRRTQAPTNEAARAAEAPPPDLTATAPPEDLIAVATIGAAWGIKGDVRLRLETDFPERLVPGRRLIGDQQTFVIQRIRLTGDDAIVGFRGIDDRDTAEALRGQVLMVRQAELPPLDAESFYHHQIIGLRAENTVGELIGAVTDIIVTGANDVYVIATPKGELLVPAIEDVVRAIEPAQGRIVVELLPGLDPVPPPAAKPPKPAGKRRAKGATPPAQSNNPVKPGP